MKASTLVLVLLPFLPLDDKDQVAGQRPGPVPMPVTFDIRVINSMTWHYSSAATVTHSPARLGEPVTFTGIITDPSFYFDKWVVNSSNHSFIDVTHNPLSFTTEVDHYIVSFFITPK